jgi:hypothetical protein
VKDTSSDHAHDRACVECIRFVAHADGVPLLGNLRTSAVIGAASVSGGYPKQLDGPTEAFFLSTPREECRLPKSQDAFHRHEHDDAKGWLPPAFVPAPSLTPPTLVPGSGRVLLIGPCKITVRSPASCNFRECRRLCGSLVLPCLGLTTQARHRGRPTRPSTRTVCLVRTDAGRSA